ncbi:hypothetical protein GH714_030480 [Hevea brasiliensis]|uniref:Phosphorylated adapter RNA export protein n=1 Tax=Hevea brasiliensis TaxID=3981 RepID=A0A6A6LW27_HEVBR|nr:hypothetical protein GH714_030480 [Hevea brasiliensis]
MEEGESVLEAIYEEDDRLEEAEDVEMVDVEEESWLSLSHKLIRDKTVVMVVVGVFVLDTCRRLKEKKSYMVYTAVGGCNSVCGGQMTADGRRFRTGGGILWNIMKTREPMAYKEIMKKAKDFETWNHRIAFANLSIDMLLLEH